MGIFESLSFHKKETNLGEIDYFYSALIYLAIFIIATFTDLFDIDVIKTLVVLGLTILHLIMGY